MQLSEELVLSGSDGHLGVAPPRALPLPLLQSISKCQAPVTFCSSPEREPASDRRPFDPLAANLRSWTSRPSRPYAACSQRASHSATRTRQSLS